MALIDEKLTAINRDIEAIEKTRRNRDQGNPYRSIDDVYNSVHELLAKHGVRTEPHVLEERGGERVSAKGTAMTQRLVKMAYHWTAEDGSRTITETLGEGLDSSDKAAGKAQTYAHKTAILQMFCIPTDGAQPDPDAESPEVLADPVLSENERIELVQRARSAGIEPAELVEHLKAMGVKGTAELRQLKAVEVAKWIDSRKPVMLEATEGEAK